VGKKEGKRGILRRRGWGLRRVLPEEHEKNNISGSQDLFHFIPVPLQIVFTTERVHF